MMLAKWIGEAILFLVGLPLIGFQCVELLSSVMEFMNEVTQQHYK
ncbi:hypothetical protein [Ammoniphilus sp. YIM 78166]|nr:hypothetical protein [Ammoniphilus sp. YIM 78166]